MTKTLLTTTLIASLFGVGCGSDDRIDGDGLAPGTAAVGGAAGSGGSGGASGAGGLDAGSGGMDPQCELELGPIDPTALLDDMEDDNGNLPQAADRTGSWYFASDKTPGASATPAPDGTDGPIPAEPIPGGRCGSRYAIRVTGQGYTNWGVVVGMGLRWDRSVDVSTFRGIRFWARRGEQHTATVRVQFQDKNTTPQGGVCTPDSDGGPGNCYDLFGTDLVPLTTEWQQYQIDFRRLYQRDFGLQQEALDTQNLYTIEWGIGPGAVFDFWVDDIWFYE